MKFFKWKIFLITALVCLSPILLGLSMWEALPETMAIHFDINNNPDNFASKGFVVFGMPIFMVLLQGFCCFVNDIKSYKHGERKKFELATKWIIPVMSIVLQILTLGIGLGRDFDVRRVAVSLVGCMLIVLGNYLPKADYVKNYNLDTQTARKLNRFSGYASVIMGILFLISLFFPPIVSVICLLLLILFAIISAIYVAWVVKRK